MDRNEDDTLSNITLRQKPKQRNIIFIGDIHFPVLE